MGNRRIFLLLWFFVLLGSASAQHEKDAFLYRAKTMYHSLQKEGLDNFSAWITSNAFKIETADYIKSDVSPIELIWKSPNRIFYIRRPIPGLSEENLKTVTELQTDLVGELKGILIDWQQFYAGNILDNLPETHLVTFNGDTAIVQYEKYDAGQNIAVKMLFGVNGSCIKVITKNKTVDETTILYPGYILVEEKWLCTNWTVQILRGSDVESGYAVNIRSEKVDHYWIPKRIGLEVQKKGLEKQRFIRDYEFINIITNKDIQFLK
ncbi:MAG: hypothetical protein E4H13_01330 [Calditrichales bacterium]|nr:MAG: hypothetical protein E4H13_01330 [Calditrichales bacterium]